METHVHKSDEKEKIGFGYIWSCRGDQIEIRLKSKIEYGKKNKTDVTIPFSS